ncbi:MAG: sulfate transporter [Alphaproteobacteria bacterium]|nr:MAG: sulfate transporter [Alphaproteobacteria bacterium]
MAELSKRPQGVPDVAEEVKGKFFMVNPQGALVPLETVKATDLLMDEAVRKIMDYADSLSAQIARFKLHTLADVAALLGVFDQEYQVKLGGTKGNVTLTTFDGTMKVQLAIAEQISFGPELQSAKKLVDECLIEWAADSRPELQAIVQRAFNTDKEGLVNRNELFGLLRLEIADERWQRAMKAIKESIRVEGTREYVRFYRRATARDAWKAVTIDVASA